MIGPEQTGSSQRRFVDVAYGILASINAGEYAVGQRLPTDRELSVEKGVSRQTVREALLVLELIGAISIRHGDGVYVSPPATPDVDGEGAILFGDPRNVIESRRLLEPITTRLAAERITDEQLASLTELIAHHGGSIDRRHAVVGLQFHAELAMCCGNPMMGGVVEQLVNIERHPLWRLVNEQALRVPGARQSQEADHVAILDAVAAHDADRAEVAMQTHLAELQTYLFAPSESLARATEIVPIASSSAR
jgi:DNA-binding FadR family transcriptional regulator